MLVRKLPCDFASLLPVMSRNVDDEKSQPCLFEIVPAQGTVGERMGCDSRRRSTLYSVRV